MAKSGGPRLRASARTPRRSGSRSIGASAFPERYRGGAFIGQHGSWNRSRFAGYKVIFVPFAEGSAVSGPPEDFLTGFIADEAKSEVYGRPVGRRGLAGRLAARRGRRRKRRLAGYLYWIRHDGVALDMTSAAGILQHLIDDSTAMRSRLQDITSHLCS